MAYEKQEWVDGDKSTPLSAERLNHMEEGIAAKAARGPKGAKGDKGDKGEPGFPTKDAWNKLVARVEALEKSDDSS